MNRIPGSIHFSFHKAEATVRELMNNGHLFDLSHLINNFQFDNGSTPSLIAMKKKFRDESPVSPLVGTSMRGSEENENYVYFLSVIRTVYNEKGIRNHTLSQYNVHKYKPKAYRGNIPSLYIRYDIAPIFVYYSFRSNSIMHFLVRIIAIIGGVITVAGIIVSFLQSSAYQLVKSLKE